MPASSTSATAPGTTVYGVSTSESVPASVWSRVASRSRIAARCCLTSFADRSDSTSMCIAIVTMTRAVPSDAARRSLAGESPVAWAAETIPADGAGASTTG